MAETYPGMVGNVWVDDFGDVWINEDVTPWWLRLMDFLTGSWRQDVRPRLLHLNECPTVRDPRTVMVYYDGQELRCATTGEYLSIRKGLPRSRQWAG